MLGLSSSKERVSTLIILISLLAIDSCAQRYIPAKSNKNAIIRVVWNEGHFRVTNLMFKFIQ